MNTLDQEILSKLEGERKSEVVNSIDFYRVNRNGHLLLGLTGDRKVAKKTLSLYQPQSRKAKLLTKTISVLIFSGLHRFLSSSTLLLREGSPLLKLITSEDKVGFLLGNPLASSRRVIAISRYDDTYHVAKIGIGSNARSSVIHEVEVLDSLPKGIRGIPLIEAMEKSDRWAFYKTNLIEGRSPTKKDDHYILGLLSDWLSASTTCRLDETGHWDKLKTVELPSSIAQFEAQLRVVSSLEVKVGIFHGDFAPWNIKIGSDSEIKVLDWEYGSNKGPMIWDWWHYLIQREVLVNKVSSEMALETCQSWMKSQIGKELLLISGWQGNEYWCLGSYLLYSNSIEGFDRDELLHVWADGLG